MNAPPLARPYRPVAAYALAVAGSVAAVALAQLLQRWLGVNDLSLVFMLAVFAVAARTHAGPAALTALLCFLAYNFFFIEPRYTLYIGARHGVATVLAFLAAALLAGRLASRLAEQVEALGEAQRHGAARQALGQQLAIAADEDAVVRAAHDAFHDALEADVWIRLDDTARHILRGTRAETVEDQGWWFLPLRAPDRVLGVLGLKLPEGLPVLAPRERDVARAMADDVTQALLRTRLVAEVEAQRVAAETERLRSGLLASVSHDLRTPLASIIGAADSLDAWGDAMPPADRSALLATVREEGERLDRYIQNLLDMTRLGHGLEPVRDWFGLDELVGAAIARVQRHRPAAHVDVHVAPALAPALVQGALIEQALHNVIDNALKFAGDDQPVEIDIRQRDAHFVIDVCDHGPGIPDDQRERVFGMFHRVERGDRGPSGTGLGLAITRAIVRAHAGDIVIDRAPGGGTCVRITLPMEPPA
ncbi:ATP-binding protein [Lysobacter sp. TY2-98]|uniref:sensor histidine kinase n=1 Tax=Lysobacter sp. TY2-98 TaxID=2290922 RepID=UPI0013B38F50|nr:ATP-binding protein [Lysobacter sp. TY2-98]